MIKFLVGLVLYWIAFPVSAEGLDLSEAISAIFQASCSSFFNNAEDG